MNNDFSSVRLEITSKCNINCQYCHNADYANKIDDLNTLELKELMASLKSEYPISKVLLTGGEPLLNDDIVDLVNYISNLGIKVDMVTNGKLLTTKLIHELENAGLKRIRISIDGFEEHTQYRKGSDPGKLWDFCRYIKENTNLNLVVHTVCSPHNVAGIERVYDKLVEIGVDRWRVFDIGYSGAAAKNLSVFGLSEYYEDFIKNISYIIKKYIKQQMQDRLDIEINGVFKTNLLGNVYKYYYNADNNDLLKKVLNVSPCDYIHHQMTIRSNGIGTLCQYFHDTIFDFKKYALDATEARWNANKTVASTLNLSQINYCKKCKYVLVCNSGCRAKAEFLTGDITNPDPVACVVMPLFYKEIVPILDNDSRAGFEKLINGNNGAFYNADDLHNFITSKQIEQQI